MISRLKSALVASIYIVRVLNMVNLDIYSEKCECVCACVCRHIKVRAEPERPCSCPNGSVMHRAPKKDLGIYTITNNNRLKKQNREV